MYTVKLLLTIACLAGLTACSSNDEVAAYNWDNMDFASVHCEYNDDSEACDATGRNSFNSLLGKGKK